MRFFQEVTTIYTFIKLFSLTKLKPLLCITISHDEYRWWYKKNRYKSFSLSGFLAYSNYRGVFFAKPLVAFPLAVGAPPVDLPV